MCTQSLCTQTCIYDYICIITFILLYFSCHTKLFQIQGNSLVSPFELGMKKLVLRLLIIKIILAPLLNYHELLVCSRDLKDKYVSKTFRYLYTHREFQCNVKVCKLAQYWNKWEHFF